MVKYPRDCDPPQVLIELADAIEKNASKVWDYPDDAEFVGQMVYIEHVQEGDEKGKWGVSSNYEGRDGWGTVYIYDEETEVWQVRALFGDLTRPYSREKAMADAQIMFTG